MSDKDSGARTTRLHGVIDRIEDNDMAVVLIGDDEDVQLDLPVSLLPEGVADGDHLRLTIELDEESRQSAADRIRQLQQELLNRSKK